MINPFKDTNWNPGTAEKRKFAVSLIIGFPLIAIVFALLSWWRTDIPAIDFLWPREPVYSLFDGEVIPQSLGLLWFALIGAGLGGLFWLLPQIARPFYLIWYFAACCIGIVVSNLLIALFFYLVITPYGLAMRACGRDPMRRRWDRSATTYWCEAEKVVDPRRYFRQF